MWFFSISKYNYLRVPKVTYLNTWSSAAIQECILKLEISVTNLLQNIELFKSDTAIYWKKDILMKKD